MSLRSIIALLIPLMVVAVAAYIAYPYLHEDASVESWQEIFEEIQDPD